MEKKIINIKKEKAGINSIKIIATQPTIICSKLTIENSRTRCEICSKLTIKALERRHYLYY